MNEGKVTPRSVALVVGQGGFWSRKQIAEALGRAKTTWVITNIELAVQIGLIEKLPGITGNREAWVYSVPGLQQVLV